MWCYFGLAMPSNFACPACVGRRACSALCSVEPTLRLAAQAATSAHPQANPKSLKPGTALSLRVFMQSVSLERFETERLLELVPPDGEFAVMNYRSTHPFKPPFRVTCTVEDDPHSAFKARLPPCHAGNP